MSAATLDVVSGMAGARWSAPRDLADAAEELAVLATAAAAGSAGNLDDVEDELFRFGRIASGEPELLAALADQRLPDDHKRGLLDDLLTGKVAPASLRLITQAVINPRGRNLEANLADYARLVADWRQRLIAVVRVATELSGPPAPAADPGALGHLRPRHSAECRPRSPGSGRSVYSDRG